MKFYDRVFEIENRGKRKSELEEEILKQLIFLKEENTHLVKELVDSIRDMRTILIQNEVLLKELIKNGISITTNSKIDREVEKKESEDIFVPSPDTNNIKNGKKNTKGKIVSV